ncbi:hypothetical protein C8N24_3586 [Solirubrobacter pauli]|uniref:DUF4440 domain-containing protein n=1 Tax=Solirubrobacter pauli TaxID=166793 RepID=A0A660LHI8_9ACTN|nr:nuclear transport factor 2 family protein [Solirubrobacter pauli]RKQ93715.1 hypothetical protein C8N24_3586 [Solirubrobacter pauli]
MVDGLTTGELALTLAVLVGVAAVWAAYIRRRPWRTRAHDEEPAALPPDAAVPVDSALVQRLYAQREWRDIRPLLTDDFVLVGREGARFGADALRDMNDRLGASYDDLHTTVELVLADLERPAVLYVRGRERGRARRGPDLDVTAWTRIVVAQSGTKVRELGPSSVISSA